jgi:hypothetical protein
MSGSIPISKLTAVKLLCGLLCTVILTSNIRTMSGWSEARGVYDDICYLRQAHLFQRFGIGGLNTDISRDDDHFAQEKFREIGYLAWNDPRRLPCHTPIFDKHVLQYPPGTGFLLALFPQGHQVVSLYAISNLIVWGFALLAIFLAHSLSLSLSAGVFGTLAVYLMINPAKASYSIAPTLALCAATGLLTALWLVKMKRNSLFPILIGLLLGLSINFRLPNLLLASGYVIFFGVSFLRSKRLEAIVQGIGFGVAFVIGMAPTLVANAINAGSPLATTYGGTDTTPPEFNLQIIFNYVRDMQFVLIVLAAGSIAWLVRNGAGCLRNIALIAAGNLVVSIVFFLTHSVFTPYYTTPVTLLSLWSAIFALLICVNGSLRRPEP